MFRVYTEFIYLLKDGDGIAGHRDRVQWLIFEDGVEDFVLVVSAERRLAEQHLVHEHAESPPVDGTAIALLQKNLGEGAASGMPL